MKKDTFYFTHDYNARNDVKILFLRHKLGWHGYGLYWMLVEALAEAGGSLPLKIIPVLSMQYQADESILLDIIENFELFEVVDNEFYSTRLLVHLELRKTLSDKGKEGVKAKELKKAALNNPISIPESLPFSPPESLPCSDPESKERKGKEIKEKEINIEANAFVNPDAEYLKIIKDKKNICQFITNEKPKFIKPFVDLWNIFATENKLTTVTKINDTRKKIFRTRIRDESFDFITVLSIAKKSEFILDGRHWFTFDWIFKNDSNYLKVIEGKFDDAAKQSHNQQNANINEQLKAAKTSNAA